MVSELSPQNELDRSPASSLTPGYLLAERYRLEEKLGSGAFGQVFAAEDTKLGRRVAIKILRANAAHRDPDALARLRQEAEILDAIEHPNIVGVHAVEESPDGLFIAMELLEGRSIEQLLVAEGVAAPARVARAARQLLSALIASHAKGVLHRDLKPENIILVNSHDADTEQAKLLDFGIAKAQDTVYESDDDGVTLVKTRGGGFLGTPRYCAPEIVVGDPAEPSADIFSLGLVLAEWLTGKERISASKQNQALAILLRPEALDVSDCPENWQPWLAKMIAKAPLDRYPSAAVALAEFERLVEPSSADILGAAAALGADFSPDFVSDTADTCVRELPGFEEFELPRENPPTPQIAAAGQPFGQDSPPADISSTFARPPEPAPPEAPAKSTSIASALVATLGSFVLILLLIFLWQNLSG